MPRLPVSILLVHCLPMDVLSCWSKARVEKTIGRVKSPPDSTVQYSTVQCQIERECVSINKILIVSDIRSLVRAGLRKKQRKITIEVEVMVRVMARVGLELI